MKKFSLIFMMMLVLVPFVLPVESNKDIPANGELTFNLNSIWELEDAGELPFAAIRELLVGEDGTVFIYDRKNKRIYIVNKDGTAKGAFGKSGEGPGEIRELDHAGLLFAGKTLAIVEHRFIHFFDRNGIYLRKKNIQPSRQPLFFLNENEYITAPTHLKQITNKEGKGKIRIYNLKTGKQSVITEFSMFRGGAINEENTRATVTNVALTPMMIISSYKNKLFYGMNDEYKVTVSDLRGKIRNVFSLTRKKRRISDKVKEDELVASAKGMAPVELLKKLAKTMPNEMTFFSKFEVHNGLIYVFTPYYIRKNIQQIDIFSPEGKYLYKAFIKVDDEYEMTLVPVIKNGYVYICLENEDGDVFVNKYGIDLLEQ